MDGEIQYIADTFLLEDFFQSLAEEDDDKLRKYAFDFGSILSGIKGSIGNFVGSQIHGKDSGGATRTIVNLLAPATFFRLHPILGLIVTGAQIFGMDIYSIYQSIIEKIKPSIEAGKPVSAGEINEAAKAAAPEMAKGASDDFLYPLREMQKESQLWGGRRGYYSRPTATGQPFLPQSKNPLLRMFSFLGMSRGSSLIVGILVWFLKTILLSAGLLVAGGAAASALGIGPGSKNNVSPTEVGVTEQAGGVGLARRRPEAPEAVSSSSGIGTYNYRPSTNDLWVESLGSQKPHERVLQWAVESYPALDQYQDIVLSTPSFWNAVRSISNTWRPGHTVLVVPKPYNTRNDVLSLFITDVANEIKKERLSQTEGSQ